MCGIIGIVGAAPVSRRLLAGLARLEYRGYDSAGIAVLGEAGLLRVRAPGKLDQLTEALAASPIDGLDGIAHTRWATHGPATLGNAHPHLAGRVAVVHNGIIENYQELRGEITDKGATIETDTDTEVVAHLIDQALASGMDPDQAVRTVIGKLEGAYGLAILIDGCRGHMYGARHGSPLAVGHGAQGSGEMYLASDALALAGLTREVTYLEDGDIAYLDRDGVRITDTDGNQVSRRQMTSNAATTVAGKGNYRHFMQKEIFEQPEVVGYTVHSLLHPENNCFELPDLPFDPVALPRLTMVACGSAYHAAMVAKYWFERYAKLPVDVDIASEFRYRSPVMPDGGAVLVVSQSGETIDTLMALREARRLGQYGLALVNVPESTIAREADAVIPTFAGPEIGVASTKALTCQLAALACLAVAFAEQRQSLDPEVIQELKSDLMALPGAVARFVALDEEIAELAEPLATAKDVLFLGRGTAYPIALEGALKLKEISYVHAEGQAAGEMKHGPIALLDPAVPVVVLAPPDALMEKTISNLEEVVARHAPAIVFTDKSGRSRLPERLVSAVELPEAPVFTAPILYTIPMQQLAYHAAVAKGTDVDQPRNLAKSVTVE